MELLSAEFLSALGAIIVIDLVLAGDNAIVNPRMQFPPVALAT